MHDAVHSLAETGPFSSVTTMLGQHELVLKTGVTFRVTSFLQCRVGGVFLVVSHWVSFLWQEKN